MLKTRKPTGLAPWPLLLVTGGQKCGKSYACSAFSASDLVDRTLWLEIGEGSADLYGAIPGARYEIVEHDGSYAGILEATKDAVAEKPRGTKPNCIVVDSATELWDLLSSEQQGIATKRGKETITMDQWNVAKRRWRQWLDVLRQHCGPVLLTTRYEQVTVVDKTGKPTTQKQWRTRAEKNIEFEVDGIIEVPKPREFYLSGMRSLAFPTPPGGHLPLTGDPGTGFTLDWFMRKLGILSGERSYVALREDPEAFGEQPIDMAETESLPAGEWPPGGDTKPPEVVSLPPVSGGEEPSRMAPPAPRSQPGMITPEQLQLMTALGDQIGMDDGKLLVFAMNVLRTNVKTLRDLATREADRVIAALKKTTPISEGLFS